MVGIAEAMVKHGTLIKTGIQTSRVAVGGVGSKIGTSSSSCYSIVRFKKTAISAAVMSWNKSMIMEVAERLKNEATPWLMLEPEVEDVSGDVIDRFYGLCDGVTVRLNRKKSLQVPNTTNCIASTAGSWLGFIDTTDASLYLSNPIYNKVIQLPSIEFLPSVYGVERDPISGSIVNYKHSVKDYEACSWDESGVVDYNCYQLNDPAYMAITTIHNLGVGFESPSCPDVVMAIQGEMPRLAYCGITEGGIWHGLQEEFSPFDWGWGSSCNQIAYSSKYKLFYSLFNGIGIQAFDVQRDRGQRSKIVSTFKIEKLKEQLIKHESRGAWGGSYVSAKHYLVTLQNGDLLLLVRHYEQRCQDKSESESESESDCDTMNNHPPPPPPPYETVHFDVFRAAYPGKLERVSCLEDRAIFVGSNQSFCIKAGEYPGIIPNSIYFTDDLPDAKDWGHDNGIFTLNNGLISPCYPYHDQSQEKQVPITTPHFWVPPFHRDATLG